MKAEARSQKPEVRSQKSEQQRLSLSPVSHLLTPGSCILDSRRASCAAFTLIEIMVVIVIIMILVGIVIGASKYAQIKAATSRAQAEIAAMETALEHYKNDNGVYPITPAIRPTMETAPGYGNSPRLYKALIDGPKQYFTFKPNQLQVIGTPPAAVTNILDPFGHLYHYYCTQPAQNDQMNTATFDLWSNGPSGTDGAPDMITNWKQ